MDMRRFLPIILIAFAALFIIPQLFKGSSSKTLSSKDRATLTRDAIDRIDKAEKAAFAKNGKYTDSLADVVVSDPVLAKELTVPLTIDLSTGAGGKSYVVTVSSDVLSLARAWNGAKIVSSSCRTLKSRTGYKCPVPPTAGTTTTTGTTTSK
ncbi:MAG: hypothetical protein ACM3QU_06115 [Verrucomicrobiota bacterium]